MTLKFPSPKPALSLGATWTDQRPRLPSRYRLFLVPALRHCVRTSQQAPNAMRPQQPLSAVLAAVKRVADEEFKQLHDRFRLIGQDNIWRYLPVSGIVLRLRPEGTETDMAIRVARA